MNMKKTLKTILLCMLVAFISAGATYGTYNYCLTRDAADDSFTEISNYAKKFDQSNFHYASLTESGYPDFTKVAEHAVNAVVQIKSTVTVPARNSMPMDLFDFFDFGFGNRGNSAPQERTQQGLGSGVIISTDGYIITNNHVIDNANKIEVTLNNGEKYAAELIGADPNTDIALLKIQAKNLEVLTFGNSDALKVGEWVLAIGNPMGLTSTVTAGIVSAKGRGGITRSNQGNRMAIESFIQTDAAINSGNSGGALVNADGQLIGINTAIYSRTGDFAGYGFAIPITIVAKVVSDLKEYGTVQRALLGVSIFNLSAAKELTTEDVQAARTRGGDTGLDVDKIKDIKLNEGVLVAGFSEQSAAKQAGIQMYDVITSINGAKVKNNNELMLQVNRYRPGDKISVAVDRFGSEKTFDITLRNDSGTTSIVKKEDGISKIGATFKELTEDKKKEYGISYGVEVSKVSTEGKFYEKGIRSGFIILEINNQKVSSVKDVEAIIQSVQAGDKELVIKGLNSSGNRRIYAVELFDE